MDLKDIINLKELKVENERAKKIVVDVMHVQKCNFNDSLYVKNLTLNLDELKERPLKWFDPYLGLNKKSSVEIALAYVSDEDIYYLANDGNEIKVVEKIIYQDYIFCDDLDEKLLLAAHVRLG